MKREQPNQTDPLPREAIPLEILDWARQTLDDKEFLAQVQEINAAGGVLLEDFITELEARANSK